MTLLPLTKGPAVAESPLSCEAASERLQQAILLAHEYGRACGESWGDPDNAEREAAEAALVRHLRAALTMGAPSGEPAAAVAAPQPEPVAVISCADLKKLKDGDTRIPAWAPPALGPSEMALFAAPAPAAAPVPEPDLLRRSKAMLIDLRGRNVVWWDKNYHAVEMLIKDIDAASPAPASAPPQEASVGVQADLTAEQAYEMGAKGAPPTESERLLFEAWMRGHCWALCATWNGKQYVSDAEQGGDLDPRAMATRQLWAAWRDRAALASVGAAQQPSAPPVGAPVPADLTDERIIEIGRYWSNTRFATGAARFLVDFARAIEREHGIGVYRHCGNCADGVPGGPERCSQCGRTEQYSHWTSAEISAQEELAVEQAEDMRRRAEDDQRALDPDDEPEFGALSRAVIQAGVRSPAGPERQGAARSAEATKLLALIDRYWEIAYAEGKEGREHDNLQGDAASTRWQIEQSVRWFAAAPTTAATDAEEGGEK